jgi:hypothetical protein
VAREAAKIAGLEDKQNEKAKASKKVAEARLQLLKATTAEMRAQLALEEATKGVQNRLARERTGQTLDQRDVAARAAYIRADLKNNVAYATQEYGIRKGFGAMTAAMQTKNLPDLGPLEKGLARVGIAATFAGTLMNKLMGAISAVSMYIGAAILVITAFKLAWDKLREAAGLSGEKLEAANEAIKASKETTKQLADTQKHFNYLVEKGFGAEAIKQRANTMNSLYSTIQNTISAVNDELEELEKRSNKTDLTWLEGLSDLIMDGDRSRRLLQFDLIRQQVGEVNTVMDEMLSKLSEEGKADFAKKLGDVFAGTGIQVDATSFDLPVEALQQLFATNPTKFMDTMRELYTTALPSLTDNFNKQSEAVDSATEAMKLCAEPLAIL